MPDIRQLHDPLETDDLVAEAVELAAGVLRIAGDYHVRNISPNDLAEMARKLYYLGAIGLGEYAIMSFQPHLLESYDPEAGRYPHLHLQADQPRDMVAEFRAHLASMKTSYADPTGIALTAAVVELLESFQPLDDI